MALPALVLWYPMSFVVLRCGCVTHRAGEAREAWLVACEGADKASGVVPAEFALASALEVVEELRSKGKDVPEAKVIKKKIVEDWQDSRPGWGSGLSAAGRVGSWSGGGGYSGYSYGAYGGPAAPRGRAGQPRVMLPGPDNPCLGCGSITHLLETCPRNETRITAAEFKRKGCDPAALRLPRP